jgi:hypothetical protein
MILSNKAKARLAGSVLLAQAITASPAVARPQGAGPADAAGVGWAAPVDSAVLRRMTAWTGDAAPLSAWSWRQATSVSFVPLAISRQTVNAAGSAVDAADTFNPANFADLPPGFAAIAAAAALRRSIGGDDSMRLLVQRNESTTLREAGGISNGTTNVTIDIGLGGLSGIRP